MIPELGHFALVTALIVALAQGVLPLLGAARGNAGWIALAKPAAWALNLALLTAFVCLTAAFVQNDFSVLYVARHSNTQLPLPYRVAAVWGGHEGSLLLWVVLLGLWTLAVAAFSKALPEAMSARILAVLGLILAGLLLFVLATSNPFERLLPGAGEGRDLNPLLQDPGLIAHPPMLYMGYVGFSVAFAFAVAALIEGRIDAAWARWSRPWTIAAWSFLTLGIALGSGWAYYELGWGGWWFWDPVENASFMPWLIGTALLHSLAVTEKRGSFRIWTVLLAISTFSLSLLGTFLVRSGVLTSVHAFATDPARGVFILILLVAAVGGALALFAWRAPMLGPGGRFGHFSFVSRESLLLANNVLLAVACATVLLGTLYPLLIDALGAGKLSVGPPYFNAVFAPLMAPVLFLLGVGPFVRWKQDRPSALARTLRWLLPGAALIGIAASLALGEGKEWKPQVALFLSLAAWIVLAGLLDLVRRARSAHGRLSAGFLGRHLAHFGVAVFLAGVTVVGGYQQERDVKMAVGETLEMAGHTFRFNGVHEESGPNYTALAGDVELVRDGRNLARLRPEKRFYPTSAMPMTEAAIDAGFLRDIYVSLGEPVDRARPEGAWIVRVHFKPLIDWIWGGCALMALGGLLAALQRTERPLARPL